MGRRAHQKLRTGNFSWSGVPPNSSSQILGSPRLQRLLSVPLLILVFFLTIVLLHPPSTPPHPRLLPHPPPRPPRPPRPPSPPPPPRLVPHPPLRLPLPRPPRPPRPPPL